MTEPFTGIYSHAIKELANLLDDKDFKLFVLLCGYGNKHGDCWPGDRRLAADTGWRAEEIVYRLQRLERMNLFRYRRFNKRDPDTGHFLPNVFRLNPRVYFASEPVPYPPENVEQEPVPQIGEQGGTGLFRPRPSKNTQPELELESEPETEPESLTTTTKTENPSNEGGGKRRALASTQQASEATPAHTKANTQAKAQPKPAPARPKTAPPAHAKGEAPPVPASPPGSAWSPVPSYVEPLPDSQLENLAHELKAIAPTKLYNARELVMVYGEPAIKAGLIQLKAALSKGNIRNPAGLLTSWLQRGVVQSEPVAAEAGSAEEWRQQFENSPYRSFYSNDEELPEPSSEEDTYGQV